MSKIAAVGVLLAIVLGHSGSPAKAAALDAENCAKLKTEQEELDKGGVRANIAKGPDWAKANLPPDKLEEIRKAIELDEQLLFRCPGRHLVNLPLEPDPPPPLPAADKDQKPDGERKSEKADSPAASPKTATPEKKSPSEKKAPPKKEKAPAQAQKAEAGTDPDAAKAQPRPKSAQKAKGKAKEDAYKPPPSDADSPFGLF